MSGTGRGGNNRRRSFKRRDRDNENGQGSSSRQGKKGEKLQREPRDNPRYDKSRGILFDRPKWTPPKMSTKPIPSPECPCCGKPIQDMAIALNDRGSGAPVHFDCVIARITEEERLEKGDAVTYIGGGRFGVVHLNNPQDTRNFKIKRILEWEAKDNRAGWRNDISDHYSLT